LRMLFVSSKTLSKKQLELITKMVPLMVWQNYQRSGSLLLIREVTNECNTITITSVSQGGVLVGCSPPLEKFSSKKSQRWDQGKNLPPPPRFLRSLREIFKGGTKGNFDLSREKSWRGDQRKFWLEPRKILKGVLKEILTWVEKNLEGGPKDILTWVEKNLEGGTKGNFDLSREKS
jgi:hypothetical protein